MHYQGKLAIESFQVSGDVFFAKIAEINQIITLNRVKSLSINEINKFKGILDYIPEGIEELTLEFGKLNLEECMENCSIQT